MPKPARLRTFAIIRGLYVWRTRELSVSNSTRESETGPPRYATTRHTSPIVYRRQGAPRGVSAPPVAIPCAAMLDVEGELRPYYDLLSEQAGGLALFDAHTHIGANDPDGFTQTPEQ